MSKYERIRSPCRYQRLWLALTESSVGIRTMQKPHVNIVHWVLSVFRFTCARLCKLRFSRTSCEWRWTMSASRLWVTILLFTRELLDPYDTVVTKKEERINRVNTAVYRICKWDMLEIQRLLCADVENMYLCLSAFCIVYA